MMGAKLTLIESLHGGSHEQAAMDRLLAGILKQYGYDFTHYSRASLKRRLERAALQAKVTSFDALLTHLLEDERHFDDFLKNMSVTVTEMFRDPGFYKAVRDTIVPILKTYPFVKIWHAGCATGEEVYSMAILLHEEGFLDRVRIYGTDYNKYSLEVAARGIYPTRHVSVYEQNYRDAGGTRDFSEYYSAGYEFAKLRDYLKEHITFSYHNLVTDGVFGEMNVICCRNVMIYFDKVLQDQVLLKFSESLRHGGYLCLGSKESLNFTSVRPLFETVNRKQRIYRKTGGDSACPIR